MIISTTSLQMEYSKMPELYIVTMDTVLGPPFSTDISEYIRDISKCEQTNRQICNLA
jgi:hypothetical protein